ncbi:hypothetical protein DRQ09_06610 [candidate division KSB1 bacterium]|nr:MAG: hypothetical protein DRQ09_06610 [candidate division KSB1 bacterium]
MSQLARLSKRVAQQYIDLLQDKVRNQFSKNNKKEKIYVYSHNKNSIFITSGETEAGSAGEQPAEE